jgi:hypothetical protein
MMFYQSGQVNNNMTDKPKPTVWAAEVRAPFKKVIAYDVLFLGLGAVIGAGIITAVLFH